MRRVFLVLAVIALFTLSAMPAMADSHRGNKGGGHHNDSWGHNYYTYCNWYPSWSWRHGWDWDYWCYNPWRGWYKLW
jgi:hypothetical protein